MSKSKEEAKKKPDKTNGKTEELIEHAEILLPEDLAQELREISNEMQQLQANMNMAQQKLSMAQQNYHESHGALRALDIILKRKIGRFSDENGIEEGKWVFNFDEGKFTKA